MDEKKRPEISFEYKISPNYVMYSVNGVYGGLNAAGEVTLNLFSERSAIPRHETYNVMEDGALADQPTTQEKKEYLIRDVMFGISMNPRTAKSLADWLNDKVTQYEEMLKKGKKGDTNDDSTVH